MPYVTWRVVGKNNRKKKQRGKLFCRTPKIILCAASFENMDIRLQSSEF